MDPRAEAEAVVVVFATFPDEATAERIGRLLLDERLVACVNVLPPIHSLYRWQGAIESGREVLCIMKTARAVDVVAARIKALHPYEVPEVVAVPVVGGLPAYLKWVSDESRP